MSEGYVGQRSGFSKTISEPQISFMNSSYQRKLCFEQRLLILIIRSLLISEPNFDVPPASFDHIHRETCCAVITLILSRFHIYWSDRFCGQTTQRERLIESQIFAFTFIPLSFFVSFLNSAVIIQRAEIFLKHKISCGVDSVSIRLIT